MRSARQRAHSMSNLIRAGTLRPRKWVSTEDCERVDVPHVLAAQPPTAEEIARNFAGRFVDGARVVLVRKERWPGAWFWFALCPGCCSHREYLLKRTDDPLAAPWRCRQCAGATWLRRRYHTRSLPPNPPRTHRAALRLARERRRHDKAVRRIDTILGPIVREEGRERAQAEARKRQENRELALALARKVAAHGEVVVTVPPRLRVAEIVATMRRLRRFREQLGR